MDIADRSDFKAQMNAALRLDPARTVALTADMQREYLDASVGQSVVEQEAADRVLAAVRPFLAGCRALGIPGRRIA